MASYRLELVDVGPIVETLTPARVRAVALVRTTVQTQTITQEQSIQNIYDTLGTHTCPSIEDDGVSWTVITDNK